MHVTEHCSRRNSVPLLSICCCDEILNVQRFRSHLDLVVHSRPGRSVAIGIYLDAQPVRVGEVNGFADEVIRHSSVRANLSEMLDERTECTAAGQQDREMIKTKKASARNGSRVLSLIELNEHAIFTMRSEL